MENDFSYEGIRRLCYRHRNEIIEIHERPHHYIQHFNNLYRKLDGREVRYIDPLGRYKFTRFGHFYFDDNGVMMLITDDKEYTRFHRPGILSHTFWSTVPVVYAGIDTRILDDYNRPIFTGDVVTDVENRITSYVRYFHPTIAGLAGDNCESQYRPGLTWHKEGTVFSGISRRLFNHFDLYAFDWPRESFCPNGISPEEVRERAKAALEEPIFADNLALTKPQRRIYTDTIDEAIQEGCVVAYFRGNSPFDEDTSGYVVFCDNYPQNYKGECYEIMIDNWHNYMETMEPGVKKFLLYAHNHPETTFVLCDFVQALEIPNDSLSIIALIFQDWFSYNIPNVVLPGWIFWQIGLDECVGKD